MINSIAQRFKRFASYYEGSSVYLNSQSLIPKKDIFNKGTIHPNELLGPFSLKKPVETGVVRMIITDHSPDTRFKAVRMLCDLGLCTLNEKCEAVPIRGVTFKANDFGITIVVDQNQIYGSPTTPQIG